MEKARKPAEILGSTIETYRLNKTQVPEEDLKGKYRDAYAKLLHRLKKEAEEYMNHILYAGLRANPDRLDETITALEDDFKKNKISGKVYKAVFENFSIEEMEKIAREQQGRNIGIVLEHGGIVETWRLA